MPSTIIDVTFIKQGEGWLTQQLPKHIDPPRCKFGPLIEERARHTQQLGSQPLWSGYEGLSNYPMPAKNTSRTSDMVRTAERYGRLYSWIAASRKPAQVVEFGTAFGVSGMYWLAGLEQAASGTLFTFEPNAIWADIAAHNLSEISSRFNLTKGTFEDNAWRVLNPNSVDIAFVDAIHTSDFVTRQYEILKRFMHRGGLVIFDDIQFSQDMSYCWAALANGNEVLASATLGKRVGVVELI
jgi:predicted O-methyltransferase YrrM